MSESIPASALGLVPPAINDTVLVVRADGAVRRTPVTSIGGLSARGLYANRPGPQEVVVGSRYFATDVLEEYFSDGTMWEVMPSGGTEIAYAEITSPFTTTSAALVDVPGLATTIRAGHNPFVVTFGGTIKNDTAGSYTRVALIVDGTIRGQILSPGPNYITSTKEIRIVAVPGSLVAVKLQVAVIGASTGELFANGSTPSAIDKFHMQIRTC